MKNLILIWLSISSINGLSQLPTNKEGQVVYSAVIIADGISKKELNKKAKSWISSTLKSENSIVELENKTTDHINETGTILLSDFLSGHNKYNKIYNASLSFKFVVFCENEKYKYEVSNFLLNYNNGKGKQINSSLQPIQHPSYIRKKQDIETFESNLKNTVDIDINRLIEKFKNSMKKKNDKNIVDF